MAKGAQGYLCEEQHPCTRINTNGIPWVAPLGNLMTRKEAQEILEVMAYGAKKAKELGNGKADFTAMARALVADPELPANFLLQ